MTGSPTTTKCQGCKLAPLGAVPAARKIKEDACRAWEDEHSFNKELTKRSIALDKRVKQLEKENSKLRVASMRPVDTEKLFDRVLGVLRYALGRAIANQGLMGPIEEELRRDLAMYIPNGLYNIIIPYTDPEDAHEEGRE